MKNWDLFLGYKVDLMYTNQQYHKHQCKIKKNHTVNSIDA